MFLVNMSTMKAENENLQLCKNGSLTELYSRVGMLYVLGKEKWNGDG